MARRAKATKRSSKKVDPNPEPPKYVDRAVGWPLFFRCQRNPFLRSQLLTALMAGTQLELERLPNAVLADVVLLAMVSREYHQAEIIDDFEGLLARVNELWKQKDFTHRVFDSIHLSTVSFITMGTNQIHCAEERYIPDMVEWYLHRDPPTYFTKEAPCKQS